MRASRTAKMTAKMNNSVRMFKYTMQNLKEKEIGAEIGFIGSGHQWLRTSKRPILDISGHSTFNEMKDALPIFSFEGSRHI